MSEHIKIHAMRCGSNTLCFQIYIQMYEDVAQVNLNKRNRFHPNFIPEMQSKYTAMYVKIINVNMMLLHRNISAVDH